MPTRFIILTIATAGQKQRKQYALQLQNEDIPIAASCLNLIVDLKGGKIEITESLRSYQKYGRITNPDIHQWILDNGLDVPPNKKPAKLIFKLSIPRNHHIITLYPYQANLIRRNLN